MPAPISSTHRNLQTNQPFYPALDNSTSKNTEYLVRTPVDLPVAPVPSGPIVGIKILDLSYVNDGSTNTLLNRSNRIAVTTDGINWIPMSTPNNVKVVTILNIPNTSNFILETDTGVLYTTSNGLNWTMVNMAQSDDGFFNLLSFSGQYLWATSYTNPALSNPANNWNTLYVSEDNGVTWTLVYSLSGFTTPVGFRGVTYGRSLGVVV